MNLPLWIWPVAGMLGLWLLSWWECREINRARDNYRAIDAERIARANAAPLGNAHRVYDRTKDRA